MRLTDDERAMLAGERGEAVRRALELQIKVGDFFGADDFVAIDSAHMMAEIESMGEPCLAWVEEMADLGGRDRRADHLEPAQRGHRALGGAGPGRAAGQAGATPDAGPRPARHPDPGHLHQLPDRLAAPLRRARRLGRHRHRHLRQRRRRRPLQLRGRAGRAGGGADRPDRPLRLPPAGAAARHRPGRASRAAGHHQRLGCARLLDRPPGERLLAGAGDRRPGGPADRRPVEAAWRQPGQLRLAGDVPPRRRDARGADRRGGVRRPVAPAHA